MNVSVLGIDLAKTIFHLYSSDKSGKLIPRSSSWRHVAVLITGPERFKK